MHLESDPEVIVADLPQAVLPKEATAACSPAGSADVAVGPVVQEGQADGSTVASPAEASSADASAAGDADSGAAVEDEEDRKGACPCQCRVGLRLFGRHAEAPWGHCSLSMDIEFWLFALWFHRER